MSNLDSHDASSLCDETFHEAVMKLWLESPEGQQHIQDIKTNWWKNPAIDTGSENR